MSSVTPTDAAAKADRILWALGLVLLVGGWLSVLHVYHWNFSAPVFFLWGGWAALLASARFLLRAAMAAAEDTGDVQDDFWKPVGRREELLLEKRSLLKAIKEIEFDREMGKMSESDAADLTRFYRQRAIEVIKALESEGEAGEALSIQEQIEREVKARLVVVGAGARNKARAAARGEAQKPETTASAGTTEAAGPAGADETNAAASEKAAESAASGTASGTASGAAAGANRKADQKGGSRKKAGQKAGGKASQQKAGRKATASQQPATAATSDQAGPQGRPTAEDPS